MNDGPQIGDLAPDFELPRDGGGTLKLSDLRGKSVVLYFYPKDDTSGCTKEAIGFSENIKAFEKAGVVIVGASKDSVKSHDKFIAKHDLSIALVSDEEFGMLNDYGVWVEKSMYGRKYMGTERATYLIDKKGKVSEVWRRVKIPGHVEAVLKAAQDL